MLSTQVAPSGVTGHSNSGFLMGAFYSGYRQLYWDQYQCSRTGLAHFSMNEWHHVAVLRSSGNMYIFLDGEIDVDVDDDCTTAINTQEKSLVIGSHSNGDNPFRGFIDELRISKGIARWDADTTTPFVVPGMVPTLPPTPFPTLATGPYLADEVTHLLMHFDGENGSTDFADDSDLGHEASVVGGVAVTTVRKKHGSGSPVQILQSPLFRLSAAHFTATASTLILAE